MIISSKHRIYFNMLVILFSVLVYSLPSIWQTNFFMTHDGMHHLIRTMHYFQGIKDGQFPVFWAGLMNKTYGSPLFIYTPPLLYIFATVLKTIGLSTFASFKLLILVFNLIFTFGGYFWLKQFFDRNSALIGSLILLFNPYRISQVYVRGAFNEFAALSLIPLILLCYYQCFFGEKKRSMVLATSCLLSLCFLLHSLLLIVLAPLFLMTVMIVISRAKSRKNVFLRSLSIGLITFVLMCFIYFPILFELNYIKFFLATSHVFKDHFLKFWQLLDPGWGFGFSMPGTKDDGMSFQLGLIGWFAVMGAITINIFKPGKVKRYHQADKDTLYYLLLLVLAIGLMMDSNISRWLYERTLLKNIQFPWRFLNLSLITLGYLGAFSVSRMKLTTIKTGLFSLMIIGISSVYLKTNTNIAYSDKDLLEYESDSTFSHEYTTIWRDKTSSNDYILSDKAYSLDKQIGIDNLKVTSLGNEFDIMENQPVKLRVNTLYFPNIKIEDNNRRIDYKILTSEDNLAGEKRDITGIIEFTTESGNNHIRITYQRSSWGRIGLYISSVGWLVVVLVFLVQVNNAAKALPPSEKKGRE